MKFIALVIGIFLIAAAVVFVKPIKQQPVNDRLSMVVVGDVMLDRDVYRAARRANDFYYPFNKIDTFLREFDVRVANLEGPITDTPFDYDRSMRMSFTFDPQFVDPIAKNFDVVSLANNHTHNFSEDGLEQTKKYLSDAGVSYFGDPLNRVEGAAHIIEKNGFRIAFVGYHAFGSPESESIPRIAQKISDLVSETDAIIVMPHWGAEYQPIAHSAQEHAGHAFIDAGADLVIGAHPHVIQNSEVYRDKKIYYSLGNFIFDQYFSRQTMEGLAIAISMHRLDDGSVSIDSEPIDVFLNRDGQPSLISP